jgi:hypothetical protein
MANSTAVLTDSKTLSTSAFSAATLAKAEAAGIDVKGMAGEAALKAAELKRCLTQIANACDSADGQLTLANNILGTVS